TAVALAALPDLECVAALFRQAEARGHSGLTAFEFMSRFALDLVSKHIPNTRLPLLAPAPGDVLIEIASAEPGGLAESTMQRLLTEAADSGIVSDAVIAGSLGQAQALWRVRDNPAAAERARTGEA